MQQTRQCSAEMFAVILVQATAPHLAVVDVEQGQEINDAMPFIFKFLSFDLARLHRLGRMHSGKRLNIRLLVQGQGDFALRLEGLGPFIYPQNATGRSRNSAFKVGVIQ